ncbi:MAG: hypothetical protein IPJ01_09700 [Micavibrio sp.]|nr:hypothetical protein [Micavibrio sp.]MBK9562077.1 hypothetical protein [Micavibrio sp.]
MNVKIENKSLRFKITEEELIVLMEGHCVHQEIVIMDKALIVVINPQGRGTGIEARLVQDKNEAYLNLLLPPSKVQKLSDMGRSRAGLQQQMENLSITLQVDVRADSRKAATR